MLITLSYLKKKCLMCLKHLQHVNGYIRLQTTWWNLQTPDSKLYTPTDFQIHQIQLPPLIFLFCTLLLGKTMTKAHGARGPFYI